MSTTADRRPGPRSLHLFGLAAGGWLTSTLLFVAVRAIMAPVIEMLGPFYDWIAGRVTPGNSPGVFSSYAIATAGDGLASAATTAVVLALWIGLGQVILVGLVAIVFRLDGRPRNWREALVERRGLCAGLLAASAWRAVWVLPLAGVLWAFWQGLSAALILVNPALISSETVGWTCHALAVGWAWWVIAGMTGTRQLTLALVDDGPRCPSCGYMLAVPESERCPECGLDDPRAVPMRFTVPRVPVLAPGPAGWVLRWGPVVLLMLAPVLEPPVADLVTRMFG